MMITLSRLYPDGSTARAVVDELKAAGLPEDDIGIIAPSRDKSLRMENADLEVGDDMVDRDRDGADDHGQAVNRAVGAGAALGGAAGLLAGLGAFVLPGIGAVVAAGWLASALGGAVVGGVAGGMVGALVESGVSENDAAQYAEGVKRGGTLVTIRVSGEDRAFYEEILAMKDAGRVRGDFDPAGMPVELRGNPNDSVKRT
jgi:uncharacterized membrane protein